MIHEHDDGQCYLSPEEHEASAKLATEINQAINRCISKLGSVSPEVLLVPLAQNAAHVMRSSELAGGNPFLVELDRFIYACIEIRDRLVEGHGKE